MTRKDKLRTPLTSYFYRFMLLVALLQTGIYWIAYHTQIGFLIQQLLTSIVGSVVSLFSSQVKYSENFLIHLDTGNFVTVNHECTGLSVIATLIAGIMASSFKFSYKIRVSLLFILSITLINSIRIIHLFTLINTPKPFELFNFYHLYFWQFIIFLCALMLFYNYIIKKYRAVS